VITARHPGDGGQCAYACIGLFFNNGAAAIGVSREMLMTGFTAPTEKPLSVFRFRDNLIPTPAAGRGHAP